MTRPAAAAADARAVNAPQTIDESTRCNYLFVSLVAADGTYERGPRGWTVERTATGTYVITHKLGNVWYVPIARVIGAGDFRSDAALAASDQNSFTIETYDTNQLANMRFLVIVLMPGSY